MTPPSKVPIPTLERLATYMRMLLELEKTDVTTISSAEVEQYTGVGAPQFRKDLSYFGEFGKPGVGYDVSHLQATIATILKIDQRQPVLLVGAGNLGAALVGFPGLAEHNFDVCAVFDNNVAKIGRKLWDLEIMDVASLPEVNRSVHARVAILAVPTTAAQTVADMCIEAGVQVMLNFAPVHLRVPNHVTVRNVSFLQELAVLSYYSARGDTA
jgi:redox-sensing transcriptional repressor